MKELQVMVVYTDDIDPGEPAERTHYLGLGGQWYEIDLSEAHGKELDEAIGRFIAAGRKVKQDQVPRPRSTWDTRTHGERLVAAEKNRAIREWAAAQEPPLPDGNGHRIPNATQLAFEQAHKERKAGLCHDAGRRSSRSSGLPRIRAGGEPTGSRRPMTPS